MQQLNHLPSTLPRKWRNREENELPIDVNNITALTGKVHPPLSLLQPVFTMLEEISL